MIHGALIKSGFTAEISLLHFFFLHFKQIRMMILQWLWCFGAWVPSGHLPSGSSYLFTQHKDKRDTEVSHCSTQERESAILSLGFIPGLERGTGGGGDSGLLQWQCCFAGVVMSHVICLPPDDRGPSVPGSPPWWQEAGAAGSGRGHFLLAPSVTKFAAYPQRLCSCTEIV